MSEAQKPATPEQGQQAMQAEIVLNEKDAHVAYSNFARVTSTAEEVIIDFCLNPNPFHTGRQEISVSQRLIMNFYTAKRLFSAMGMTLQRHEQTFGAIELDIRRRATGAGPQGAPATGS
jgi:ribosomal protein L31